MKYKHLTLCLATVILTAPVTARVRAADNPTPAENKPDRDELREKLKNMTPDERRAAIQEWREKNPAAAARMKEMQQRREEFKNLTPEEREAKMKERRAVMETRVAGLEKKKAEGTLTEQESQQLERMERFLKAGPHNRPGGLNAGKGSESHPGGGQPAPEK